MGSASASTLASVFGSIFTFVPPVATLAGTAPSEASTEVTHAAAMAASVPCAHLGLWDLPRQSWTLPFHALADARLTLAAWYACAANKFVAQDGWSRTVPPPVGCATWVDYPDKRDEVPFKGHKSTGSAAAIRMTLRGREYLVPLPALAWYAPLGTALAYSGDPVAMLWAKVFDPQVGRRAAHWLAPHFLTAALLLYEPPKIGTTDGCPAVNPDVTRLHRFGGCLRAVMAALPLIEDPRFFCEAAGLRIDDPETWLNGLIRSVLGKPAPGTVVSRISGIPKAYTPPIPSPWDNRSHSRYHRSEDTFPPVCEELALIPLAIAAELHCQRHPDENIPILLPRPPRIRSHGWKGICPRGLRGYGRTVRYLTSPIGWRWYDSLPLSATLLRAVVRDNGGLPEMFWHDVRAANGLGMQDYAKALIYSFCAYDCRVGPLTGEDAALFRNAGCVMVPSPGWLVWGAEGGVPNAPWVPYAEPWRVGFDELVGRADELAAAALSDDGQTRFPVFSPRGAFA